MTVKLSDAAAAWATPQRVLVNGTRIRFREAGEGPAIVLVHGLGISADYWFRNGPELAIKGFRVLAPDLPGFGRTPSDRPALRVEQQAEALAHLARTLDLSPAVYVGHSLSCQSVLQLAADQPSLVRGLVLAAPTGAPVRFRLPRQAWGLFLDAWREPFRLFPTVAKTYLQAGLREFFQTWHYAAEHQPLALLPRVRAPGIVVVGKRDPVVPPEYAEVLASGLQDGRVVWVAGGAHAVLLDRSRAFNRAVTAFMQRLESPGAPRSPTPAAAT